MGFEKGNKYAQQWTVENATPRLLDALEYAINDEDCLSLQDAILHTGIPTTTFYELVKNHDVLKSIKEDIHTVIIARVNKGSVKGSFSPSPSIWRMKQLGEVDKSEIKQHLTGGLKNDNEHRIIIEDYEDD